MNGIPRRAWPAITVTVAITVSMAGGCVRYTTPPARAAAAALSKQVDDYRLQQQRRIDALNREYRFAFARLIDEVEALNTEKALQQFDLDAQGQADALLTDWEKQTLPKTFRDDIADAVTRGRARVEAARKAVVDARNAYADAWKDVSLDVAQLKTVGARLDALSQPEDEAKATGDFVVTVAQLYQKLRDADQKKANTDSGTPKAANANGGGGAAQ